MSTIAVTRVIPAPVEQVWDLFADLDARRHWLPDVVDIEVLAPAGDQAEGEARFGPGAHWRETRSHPSGRVVTEELVVLAVEAGRRAVLALAGADELGELTYQFTPVEVGTRRGGTAVTVSTLRRPHGLANRLLSFFVAGFVARTAEGALRSELDALSYACLRRSADADAAAA